MMNGQARLSVGIMGFDTHMILGTVPAPHPGHRTGHPIINPPLRHYAGTLPGGVNHRLVRPGRGSVCGY
jgi:hypothetical protein